MGYPKAWLPWGGRPMLTVVTSVLEKVVDPIVVVKSPGQRLPDLPSDILITADASLRTGPLEGLRAGLRALRGRTDWAFVTACDMPKLATEVIDHLVSPLRANLPYGTKATGTMVFGYDAIVPVLLDEAGRSWPQVLHAIYRVAMLPAIEAALTSGERSLRRALQSNRVLYLDFGQLDLYQYQDSFSSCNEPSIYFGMLRENGLPSDRAVEFIRPSTLE